MGDFDLSDKDDIKKLCSKMGILSKQNNFMGLTNNHLTPSEFNCLSSRIKLRLSDPVHIIHSNLQKAFNDGLIVIIDNNYIHRKVTIKNIKLFVDHLLGGVCSLMTEDLIQSIQKLFEFILKDCLVNTKHNEYREENIYKIRFPHRVDDIIYIFIFKIKILEVCHRRRISVFGRYKYIADIICLGTVFYTDKKLF